MVSLRRWRNATTLIRGVVDRHCDGHLVDHQESRSARLVSRLIDASADRQIARYRRPGFNDPRQKEIERPMRDYFAGRTTNF
jgi:hypothetical protein